MNFIYNNIFLLIFLFKYFYSIFLFKFFMKEYSVEHGGLRRRLMILWMDLVAAGGAGRPSNASSKMMDGWMLQASIGSPINRLPFCSSWSRAHPPLFLTESNHLDSSSSTSRGSWSTKGSWWHRRQQGIGLGDWASCAVRGRERPWAHLVGQTTWGYARNWPADQWKLWSLWSLGLGFNRLTNMIW
jgi:hypothetical protein